ETPTLCQKYSQSFSQGSDLVTHDQLHDREKPHKCLVFGDLSAPPIPCSNGLLHLECEKSFSWSSHMICHQKIHTREQPYTCGECGKSFSQSSDLVVHQHFH
ncbi:ZSCA2 protein, partial [Thryothorus ludovicianus]|nr:ZSCA2 protein [Thryothorus ludovicianus]